MALTAEQRHILNVLLGRAKARHASPKVTKALVEAGLVESNLTNPHGGDRDSQGVLQQRPSQGWGTPAQVTNPAYAADKFIDAANQLRGKYGSAGALAQAVQRSAFPERYQQRSGEASALLAGFQETAAPAMPMATAAPARSSERQALLQQYVLSKGSTNPDDALLGLAAGLNSVKSSTAAPSAVKTSPSDDGSLAAQLAERANQIDAKHLPYKWGGGHGGRVDPRHPVPLDCSGAVSAVLGIDPRVSGEFTKWGKPGDGGSKGVTIYANAEHVFMKIGGHYFGTSRTNPGGGAGWIPQGAISKQYLAGFTARHA